MIKPNSFIRLLLLLQSFMTSCNEWPKEKLIFNTKIYSIREERGFAFTTTVYDYRFYRKRKLWFDKELGNILLTGEVPADSIKFYELGSDTLNRIAIFKQGDCILDSTFDFENTFSIDIGSRY